MSKIDIFAKTTSCVDIENDAWDILNFEIMKSLKEENEELKNKLTKYKRAFEILKDKLDIDVSCDDFFPDDVNYILWAGIEPATISKEEYELLEEVLK